MKRLGLSLAGLGLALLCLAFGLGTASAQDKYPSKPVKIVVPYAPGGATDITSRLFGDQFRQILGQQFVVENKPGAFGVLAIEEMARSKPDGYTLFVGNVSTNAITPVLFQKKFSINFEKDVVSVSRLAIYPSFLVTTAQNFEPKSVAELIAQAKKNPGKVRYTSAGVGSFPALIIDAELAALMKAVCASPTTRSLIMPAAPVLFGMWSISMPARLEKISMS